MTELTDRMRTCAAHLATVEISEMLTDEKMEAILDARNLLIEASNELELIPAPLGEPMAIIPPVTVQPPIIPNPTQAGTWVDPGGSLPTATPSRNACPKCDSRAAKTVHRQGNHFVLECPVCGHAWKR